MYFGIIYHTCIRAGRFLWRQASKSQINAKVTKQMSHLHQLSCSLRSVLLSPATNRILHCRSCHKRFHQNNCILQNLPRTARSCWAIWITSFKQPATVLCRTRLENTAQLHFCVIHFEITFTSLPVDVVVLLLFERSESRGPPNTLCSKM